MPCSEALIACGGANSLATLKSCSVCEPVQKQFTMLVCQHILMLNQWLTRGKRLASKRAPARSSYSLPRQPTIQCRLNRSMSFLLGYRLGRVVDRNAHLRPLRSMPRGYAGFRSACRRGWCSGASRAYGGPRRIRSRDAACSDCPTPCIREDSTGAYKHAPVA